ncbi:hypothetical protein F5Y05DRAFT_424995 [Hypoxylon sp. FL0543]|nr:hypothetical protein F5Y05DRAFT_424995 [Hypoxylon sp. FL0543]
MSTNPEASNVATQRLVLNSTLPCANHSDNAAPCNKAGDFACGNCLLVAYCSKTCQIAHWPIHRVDCKSPLMKSDWEPAHFPQQRTPGFLDDDLPETPNIYLWGDVPAMDVIRLDNNEGRDFQAPGNLRNALFSVVNLPEDYRGHLEIVLNDNELAMVARNVIFLLIFFLEDNPEVAAEYVLHVWYSVLLTKPCHSMLQDKIKPVVKAVCDKIAQKPSSTLQSKIWTFGDSSLRLILTRDNWFSLLSYFDLPQDLTADSALLVRSKVMADSKKVNRFEEALCSKPGGPERVAAAKFRSDGILLPYGQRRDEFTVPNPTIFRAKKGWPMVHDADPTLEWPMKAVHEFDIGPAKKDFCLSIFHRRLRSTPVAFEHLLADVRSLPDFRDWKLFDRIDASNLPDIGYIGVNETLKTLSPLLQPTTVNSHATLVMLFVNAINEMIVKDELDPHRSSRNPANTEGQMVKVMQLMPKQSLEGSGNKNYLKTLAALPLVENMDGYFNRYMQIRGFEDNGKKVGLQMKDNHTIIDRWPLKAPDRIPTKEDQEYFALLLASGHSGQHRYVEWKRIAETEAEDAD